MSDIVARLRAPLTKYVEWCSGGEQCRDHDTVEAILRVVEAAQRVCAERYGFYEYDVAKADMRKALADLEAP